VQLLSRADWGSQPYPCDVDRLGDGEVVSSYTNESTSGFGVDEVPVDDPALVAMRGSNFGLPISLHLANLLNGTIGIAEVCVLSPVIHAIPRVDVSTARFSAVSLLLRDGHLPVDGHGDGPAACLCCRRKDERPFG
jgi:hypothetical protein